MAQPANDKPNRPRWAFDLFRNPFAPRKYKPLPIPSTHYDDSPKVYWQINRKWLSHVIGAVDLLAQDDAWQGDDDQRYNATQEAERLMTQDLPLITPELLKFKRIASGTSWKLQVSFDGGANYIDTQYTFIGNAILETSIHQDVTELSTGEVLGAVEKIDSPANPTDERVYRTYLIHLDKSKLERGDTGATGAGIFLVDPPSTVVDPNQPPEVSIVGTTDDGVFIQIALPRVPELIVGDVLPLPPGSAPTVDFTPNDVGDVIVDFGLTTGDTGETGSVFDIDEDAPEIGTEKTYDAIVTPDGFVVSQRLKENDVITVPEQAKGLWYAKNEFASGDYVSDENGITVGAVEDVGRLMHAIKRPASDVFGDEAFYTDVLTIDTDDTNVVFRQARRTGFLPGGGYLKMRYTIFRPNLDFHIIGTHDFKPNNAGWHGVGADESNDVNWGGGWTAGTTPPTSGGFVPEYNATAGMFSLSIAPPIGAPLTRVDDVTLYWEEAAGDFFWTVKTYYGGNWHYSTVPRLSGATGNDTIHVNTSCEKMIIHMNSYGVGTNFWRCTKVEVTGAES